MGDNQTVIFCWTSAAERRCSLHMKNARAICARTLRIHPRLRRLCLQRRISSGRSKNRYMNRPPHSYALIRARDNPDAQTAWTFVPQVPSAPRATMLVLIQ